MINVSFLDMKSPYLELKAELDEVYHRVMSSGWYILGKECEAFENEFAQYCQVDHCVGTSNGLDAIECILQGYEIGAGDEVIVPSNTFIATWLAVTATGAKIVPVEPNEKTFNIDSAQIEKAITPKTRAIIVVHLYGQPADMDPILEIADRYGLKVIEDAAQAHGARYKNRMVGSLGHAAAFSFYPSKNLGAFGDGGAITSSDTKLIERIKMYRNYGSTIKYAHEFKGKNARLDELQAGYLRIKLKYLNEWNERRKHYASQYSKQLDNCNYITLPFVSLDCEPVWHLYVIKTKLRNELHDYLTGKGIQTMVHYPIAPHMQVAYTEMAQLHLPVTEKMQNEILSLPMGPHLTQKEFDYIVESIKGFNI